MEAEDEGTGYRSEGRLTFTVNPKPLTITPAPDIAIPAGQPLPTIPYTCEAGGLLPGDALTGQLAVSGELTPGAHPIALGTLSAGPNYRLVLDVYKRQLLHAEEKITLIPVGPLTNIGMAIRADPRIVEHIEEIMIMGGGYLVNNTTPMAEYNVWVDPESLEVVLQSGCKVTLVPLDATHEDVYKRQAMALSRQVS